MRRRFGILLAMILAVQPVAVLSAGSAMACDRNPCHARCDVNEPAVGVGEDGTIAIEMPYRLIDCYY